MNSAARLVTGTRKYDHITPVLKQLHWLPINKRIEFKLILPVFKSLNGLEPVYLRDRLVFKTDTHGLRSSGQHLLDVPSSNTKSY